MEVFDGHTPPKPTALFELEEQDVLQKAAKRPVELTVEMDELSRERVCVKAIDELLRRQRRAKADLECAGHGSVREAGAQLDVAVTERQLDVVAGIAGEVIVHQATKELQRAA